MRYHCCDCLFAVLLVANRVLWNFRHAASMYKHRMRIALLLVVSFMGMQAAAQSTRYKDTIMNGKLYHHVNDPPFKGYYHYEEEMPEPGYDVERYFKEHLQYPAEAKKKKIHGRVIVQFVVNEDGSISNCKIIRGIGGGCDEEAVRVVRSMPHWKVPRKDWKPIKTDYTLPIKFTLE